MNERIKLLLATFSDRQLQEFHDRKWEELQGEDDEFLTMIEDEIRRRATEDPDGWIRKEG